MSRVVSVVVLDLVGSSSERFIVFEAFVTNA